MRYFNNVDHHLWEFTISRDMAAGVYQLWLGDTCMYVGQTVNIFNRIGAHWKRDFDRIVFEHCLHQQDRMNLEEMRIKELKPVLNKKGVSEGGLRDRRLKKSGLRGSRVIP